MHIRLQMINKTMHIWQQMVNNTMHIRLQMINQTMHIQQKSWFGRFKQDFGLLKYRSSAELEGYINTFLQNLV